MSDGYTKLFADIVDSSIWAEDSDTKVVWVTLLALCNADGFVRGSPGWLASKARVSVNVCQRALTKFESPDPSSRTEANEGRRIQSVDRGWQVLNYQYFRNEHQQLSTDPRRVYQREWMRKKREELRLSTSCQQELTSVNPASASASASVPEGKGDARGKGFQKPSMEEVKLAAAKSGLPDDQAEAFWHFYESKGWLVGKAPMKSWVSALAGWNTRWRSGQFQGTQGQPPRKPVDGEELFGGVPISEIVREAMR